MNAAVAARLWMCSSLFSPRNPEGLRLEVDLGPAPSTSWPDSFRPSTSRTPTGSVRAECSAHPPASLAAGDARNKSGHDGVRACGQCRHVAYASKWTSALPMGPNSAVTVSPGLALHHVRRAAGGHHVAGVERQAPGAEVVGEPDHDVPRVAEDVGARALARHLAVHADDHRLAREIAVEPILRRAARGRAGSRWRCRRSGRGPSWRASRCSANPGTSMAGCTLATAARTSPCV